MICRFYVECPGCLGTILLRLSVGYGPEDNFYFSCGQCHAVISGVHHIVTEPEPATRLVLQDAKLVDESQPVSTANVHPDFPSVGDADTADAGGFPFMSMTRWLGDGFEELSKRLSMFNGMVTSDWSGIQRMLGYYVRRDWPMTLSQAERLYKSQWTSPEDQFDAHDRITQTLGLLFGRFVVNKTDEEMQTKLHEVMNGMAPHRAAFQTYLDTTETDTIVGLQAKLFHIFGTFVSERRSLYPGLGVVMLRQSGRLTGQRLRLFQESFPRLRDFYINAFEVSHSTLQFVVAFGNIASRGNPDAFPNGKPTSMTKFRKMVAADKVKVLGEVVPELGTLWNGCFDRDLRNAIGHASVYHDLASGQLRYDDAPSSEYVDFLDSVIRTVPALLFCAHVLKYVSVGKGV